MTDKHTPGPWEVYGGTRAGIDKEDGSFSIVVAGYDDDECGIYGHTDAEAAANARLIAAAPDLLAACRAALEGQSIPPFEKYEMIRAAIAKATGGVND